MLDGLSLALPTLRSVAALLLSRMLGTYSMHDACGGIHAVSTSTIHQSSGSSSLNLLPDL